MSLGIHATPLGDNNDIAEWLNIPEDQFSLERHGGRAETGAVSRTAVTVTEARRRPVCPRMLRIFTVPHSTFRNRRERAKGSRCFASLFPPLLCLPAASPHLSASPGVSLFPPSSPDVTVRMPTSLRYQLCDVERLSCPLRGPVSSFVKTGAHLPPRTR